jgi:hypothetical protein
MPKGPLTRTTEEEYFGALREEFKGRLEGANKNTLKVIDDCIGDLVAVARSAIPQASERYEAPIIMTVLAALTVLGQCCRDEVRRQGG